jgi:pilus assembly protein CpaC
MKHNRSHLRIGRHKALAALFAASAMLCATGANAAAPQTYASSGPVDDVAADGTGYGGQVGLAEGGSRVLRFTQPIGRVMVGDPKIVDVVPLTDRTLYVLAKKPGSTSLTVMSRGSSDQPLATFDVRVGFDVEALRRALHDIIPGEDVQVSSRGSGLVLTGVLASSAVASRAAALAEQYAPGHVVNLASIRGAEQVMLQVRVSEVNRSVLKQLGIDNINGLWDTTGTLLLAPPAVNPNVVASILGKTTIGDHFTIQGVFNALDEKGLATTLAEPNLVALSGETAVFFAGGEFPIPVPQFNSVGLSSNITIEYKQYGVSVGFTPTVDGDTINLIVSPEVSALDPQHGVTLAGFNIPGITARRASTTIELRDGQSFAIAGLIKRDFTNDLRGIPGAASLPIFGALFRSTAYSNNESEVVIIVTAHLAKPTGAIRPLIPTELRRAPTEAELLFTDTTDVPLKTAPPAPTPTAHP